MSISNKIISVISAICLLGGAACFSVFAAEPLFPSADEDTVTAAEEPAAPAVEPAAPEPAAPIEDPQPADDPIAAEPQPADPTVQPDPGYTDPQPAYEPDPDAGTQPSDGGGDTSYSPTYSDVISDGNFPQPTYTPEVYSQPSAYVDNTQQYNQYLYNTTQAQYDDNYIYVPEYQEPTESLISTPSKSIDTDELTNADWNSIILDLSNGAANTEGGTQTFNFIKDNEEEGDTDMMWLVYVGTVLILLSILLIIFVVVSTSKANAKHEYYYV